MKHILNFVLFFCGVFSPLALAGNNDPTNGGPKIKKNGAVTEYSETDGFKLSDRAKLNLGVSFQTLSEGRTWTLPASALIHIKRATAVYRMWDEWITMVFVEVIHQKDGKVRIKSVDLEPGDEVAISGAPFLRMTDADLNSDTVDSCTH